MILKVTMTRKSYFIGIFPQEVNKILFIQGHNEPNTKWENLRKTQNSSLFGGDLWWLSLISYHVVRHIGC